jgi:LPXTG-site transpeptidase (sortase) family protein
LNQILTTTKIYVTPELKRKKKFYKFDFFLSVFLVCALFSLYIYAEYDKNKSEEVSKEILSNVSFYPTKEQNRKMAEIDDTTIKIEDNVVMVVLDGEEQEEVKISELLVEANQTTTQEPIKHDLRYSEGEEYYTVAIINIPKIGVNYPILSRTSDALLKISPTKFWGPEPNEVGNFCIVGHNYRNRKFFSKVPTLEYGDTVELTDMTGRMITYAVYDKYTVDPTDVSCTSQHTNGKKELTLITCTNDSKARVVLKLREM